MKLRLLKGRKIKSKFFLFGEGYCIPLIDFNVEIKRNNSILNSLHDDITINIVLSKSSLCITDFNKFDIETDKGTFLGCYIQSIYDNKTITLKPDYYLC